MIFFRTEKLASSQGDGAFALSRKLAREACPKSRR